MKLSTTLLSVQKPWREAASLMLCCPTEISGGQKSVAYLVTKRSKKSKFMPGGLCFPGGTVSPVDSSSDWLNLYKNSGINLQLMSASAHRPPIYTEDADERKKANLLPAEVSLRLTALRETFEECGLLLTTNSKDLIIRSPNSSSINPPELQDEKELLRWQDKVKENPEEFLNLCKTLRVLPDLTSLYEWSNWLTPPTFQSKQRFDTVFYITCVPHKLTISLDCHESETAEWATAESLVKGHEGEHLQLLPPQYYEMSRLVDVHSVDDITKLGDARRRIGFERWLPSVILTDDGVTSILPGDELYPENPDPYHELTELTKCNTSDEDLLKSTKLHHRWKFFQGMGKLGIHVNIKDRFGHFYSVSKMQSS